MGRQPFILKTKIKGPPSFFQKGRTQNMFIFCFALHLKLGMVVIGLIEGPIEGSSGWLLDSCQMTAYTWHSVGSCHLAACVDWSQLGMVAWELPKGRLAIFEAANWQHAALGTVAWELPNGSLARFWKLPFGSLAWLIEVSLERLSLQRADWQFSKLPFGSMTLRTIDWELPNGSLAQFWSSLAWLIEGSLGRLPKSCQMIAWHCCLEAAIWPLGMVDWRQLGAVA